MPKPCEDAERRIDRPRLQTMSHILQARGNIDLLWAMPSALAAMDAITYQLGRSGSHGARGEILRQPRPATVSKTGVIGGKTAWDIDSLRAGHAVVATRTGHAVKALEDFDHARDGLELRGRHGFG